MTQTRLVYMCDTQTSGLHVRHTHVSYNMTRTHVSYTVGPHTSRSYVWHTHVSYNVWHTHVSNVAQATHKRHVYMCDTHMSRIVFDAHTSRSHMWHIHVSFICATRTRLVYACDTHASRILCDTNTSSLFAWHAHFTFTCVTHTVTYHVYACDTHMSRMSRDIGLTNRVPTRTTHNARTGTLVPNKSVALSASACQVSLHWVLNAYECSRFVVHWVLSALGVLGAQCTVQIKCTHCVCFLV